ncbi:MAG TPA: nitrile hydratase subunit beta, partial [Acidimicrobiaceae bacterium]|nr:nitrile hydratase subunit beta [Acidimicrobiaceae bacterium]
PGEFRHALERLAPRDYFDHGYYGRWLAGLELLLTEYGVLEPGELDRRLGLPAGTGPAARAGRPAEVDPKLLPDGTPPEQDGEPDGEPDGTFAGRHLARPPRFRAGDAVVTVPRRTSGHTRLPAYATGKRGVVVRHHRAEVLPDSTAHDLGERPQHVYSVGFEASELWGAPAEPGVTVHVDLYENYLDAAPAA